MKPLIICAEINSDGQIIMSEKDFKEYIYSAYEAGFKDGSKTKYHQGVISEPFFRGDKLRGITITCDNIEQEVFSKDGFE